MREELILSPGGGSPSTNSQTLDMVQTDLTVLRLPRTPTVKQNRLRLNHVRGRIPSRLPDNNPIIDARPQGVS